MKILLTGSTGLVGKNILSNHAFNTLDLICPSRKELELLSYDKTLEFITDTKPDFIIHAAGTVGGIQANVSNPLKFFEENTLIGLNLINSAYKNGVKKFLNLGSSCMYPKNAPNPLSEESLLQGTLEPTNEGYALAKITTAKYCNYISKEKKLGYKTVIPCNLYGPFDNFNSDSAHMIPAAIKKIHEAKIRGSANVEIWGDGTAKREFMSAYDFSDFILFALEHFDEMPELMNVGIGKDYSINEYYQFIAEEIEFNGSFINDLSKPKGMDQKIVDIEKLNKFGWEAKISIREGIKETYAYFLKESNEI